MAELNPYKAPQADVDAVVDSTADMTQLASGQRLVIYGILIYVGAAVLPATIRPLVVVLCMAAFVVSVVGIIRLAWGMGHSLVVKILLLVSMLVPLVNLIALLVMSSQATARLRAAGYKVGLLGASKKKV